VVNLLPGGPCGDTLAELAPALVGKELVDDRPTAYVCELGSCREPTTEVESMLEQAFQGWEC
jgi:hypothetical protein